MCRGYGREGDCRLKRTSGLGIFGGDGGLRSSSSEISSYRGAADGPSSSSGLKERSTISDMFEKDVTMVDGHLDGGTELYTQHDPGMTRWLN